MCHVADLPACGGAGIGGRHSVVLEVAREQLDMCAHVVGELAIEGVALPPCRESTEQLARAHHPVPSSTSDVAATDARNAFSSADSCRRPRAVIR